MPELKIYKINMQDDIENFYNKCFKDLGWEYEPNGRHSDIVNILNEYMQNGCFWCLYEDKKLIGTVAVRTINYKNKIAELKRLYVLHEEQGKGYGNLLFGTAVKYAKDNGFNKICADTRNDRNASRHLMIKHGFNEVEQYNDNVYAELFYELIFKKEKNKIDYGMPTLIEHNNMDQCVSLCTELGLQFIEINMNMPQYQIDNLDIEQLKIASEKGIYFTIHLDENLDIADFNNKVSQAYLDTVLETIKLSKELKIPIINMHMSNGVYFTLPTYKFYLYEKYNDDYMSSLLIFREKCEKLILGSDIKICIENCGGYFPFVKKGIELLLESDCFNLTFDIGHNFYADDVDEEFIISNKDRLCHMHIHDATKDACHLVLGTGEIDLNSRLSLAKSRNCRCVIETKSVLGLRESVAYLRKMKGVT